MIFDLKHKNISVLQMEIDDATGSILKVTEVYEPSHIPMGVRFDRGIIDRKALNQWLTSRSIPASRENIREVLDVIGLPTSVHLIAKCYGLSLSDCYWIYPQGQALDFNKINFFENDFSKDMGEILFGKELKEFSLMSPDNTSDGWLKKKWIIREGERYLVKGASGVYRQEPYNEKIASFLCEQLGLPYVKYEVELIDEMPYSLCKNFLSADTELISAWSVYSQFKKSNNVSPFEHLIDCYEKIGVKGAREQIEKMLTLDFLMANTDRHMNNFGIVRNSETLEVLGIAPIFDSGTSLFMSLPSALAVGEIASKPFTKTHGEQIKLVTTVADYSQAMLNACSDYIAKTLAENPFMDKDRIGFVQQNFEIRATMLTEQTMEQTQVLGHTMT